MEDCDSGRTCENRKTSLTAEANETRTVTVNKTEVGFGIEVKNEISQGGPMKFFNGKLYVPLPDIMGNVHIIPEGAADRAGLRMGDYISEVNGMKMNGMKKEEFFNLMECSDTLIFTIISVAPQESERLNSNETSHINNSNKQEFPISVPNYNRIVRNGEILVVYKIYIAGKYLCSKRYSEFFTLHNNLQAKFPDFSFPSLPERWPISLTDQQLKERRSGLQNYLQNICAVKVIAENAFVQNFLKCFDEKNGGCLSAVDLKILLPNRITVVVNDCKNSSTEEVYWAVVEKIGMSKDIAKYFRLFEVVDGGFERMLEWGECPSYRYIQNYRTNISTCLLMRKWLFTLSKEIEVSEDSMAASFFFWQAIDDINKGQIKPGSKINEIRAFQKCSRKYEYLNIVRLLDGYGEISFPHCACDARKEGHVIAIVGMKALRLQACKDDGTMELNVAEFSWDRIKTWTIDAADMTFSFQYCRPNKLPRSVKLFTPYFTFMLECFQRIQTEKNWFRSTDSVQ